MYINKIFLKAKKCMLTAGLSFILPAVFASTVTSYTVDGLKRTSKDYFDSLIAPYMNLSEEEFDLHEIETKLYSQGIFSNITFNIEEKGNNESCLKISLNEKISFFPVPLAYYSGDKYGLGGFVVDFNAAGRKDVFIAGGLWSNSSSFAMLAYSHASKSNLPDFASVLSFSSNNHEITDADNKLIFDFDNIEIKTTLSLSEHLGEHFTVSEHLSYGYIIFDDSDVYNDFQKISGSITLSAGNVDWNGYFLLANNASIKAKFGYSTEFDVYKDFEAGFIYQHSFFTPRIRSILSGAFYYEDGVPLIDAQKAGDFGSKILPADFRSSTLADATVSFEWAAVKSSMLTLSFLGGYEGSLAKDYDDEYFICHGPTFGTFVYLEQLAIPAVGVTYSYNVNKNIHNFKAVLGVSF